MRAINDTDTQQLSFDCNGDFTKEEADDLKQFILKSIIGQRMDYKFRCEQFCGERGYLLNIDDKAKIVTITKP